MDRVDQRFDVTFTVPIAIFSDKGTAKAEDIEKFLNFFLHGHVTKTEKGTTRIGQQAFPGGLVEHAFEHMFKVVEKFFKADQMEDYEGIGNPEVMVMGTGLMAMGGDGIKVMAVETKDEE